MESLCPRRANLRYLSLALLYEHGRHHPLRISARSCRIGLIAVDFPLALYVCLEREGSSLVSLFNLFSSLFLL